MANESEERKAAPQITCWDGSQAIDYTYCPDISTQWTSAGVEGTGEAGLETEGWTPPAWWDDPKTATDSDTMEKDEFAEYIYNLYGGKTGTKGMSLKDFWETYGGDFPSWEESGFEKKYENVLEQLGMLNASIGFENKEFNLDLDRLGLKTDATLETALTSREGLRTQVENQFLTTGGVVSGRNIQATKRAGENTNQALSLELKNIDIESDLLQNTYTQELINIEDRRLDYETELINIEDSYEKHLINLKNTMAIQFPDCPEGETKCPNGSCVGAGEDCSCEAQNLYQCEGFCSASESACTATLEKIKTKDEMLKDLIPTKPGETCFTDSTGMEHCTSGGTGGDDWFKPDFGKDDDKDEGIAEWWEEYGDFNDGMEAMCQEGGANNHWDPDKGDCVESAGGYEWGGDVVEPSACPQGTVFEAGGCYGIDPDGTPFCTGACAVGMTAWDLITWDGDPNSPGCPPWENCGVDYGSSTANTGVNILETILSGVAILGLFFSDSRLKKNINKVDQSPSGLDVYEFEYQDSIDPTNNRYRGVMADKMPNNPAVSQDSNGYYKVDYDKIDVNFEKVS